MKWSVTIGRAGKASDRRGKGGLFLFVIAFAWIFVLYLLTPVPTLALAQRMEGPPLELEGAVEVHGMIYSIWANLCADAPPVLRRFFDLQNQALIRWL